MTSPSGPAGRPVDLAESRRRIDVLDEQLVEVLAERARVVAEVVRYKRAEQVQVIDRSRQDRVLAKAERRAVQVGLEPRIARHVLRAVIESFVWLEDEQLGAGFAADS